MRDRSWRAVDEALRSMLTPQDVVLAPRGGWRPFPCRLRQYDAVIEPDDATVLVLHKGRLPGIGKARLAELVADWPCVFANEVFAVFARARRRGAGLCSGLAWRRHLQPVRAYLASRERKRRASTVWHVHLPKTGGTSLWASLSRAFRSSVYYGDVETFLARPPEPGEYDLVGVHFAPSLFEALVGPDDLVVGLVREPTARFLSGVVHCRRPGEDAATFTASQRAMRELRLRDFVAGEHGRYETRVQLCQLGRRPDGEGLGDETALLARALAFVGRDRTLVAPSEASEALMTRLEQRLGRRLPRPPPLNANDPAEYARYAAEFAEARPAIMALNGAERRLYAEVRERFGCGPGGEVGRASEKSV